jgi:predicted branched-subunit amino acid permease
VGDRFRSLWQGIRSEFPLLVGVFPFGLIYGAAAVNAGLSAALAQSMSWIVFAGSAQILTVQLIHTAAPSLVVIAAIAVVNLRHALYSASVAPYIEHLPLRWKGLLGYLLTDEAYAATIVHYEHVGVTPTGHWFFLGAGASLWLVWQVSTGLGVWVAAHAGAAPAASLQLAAPVSLTLDFALPLTFIAMMVPVIKDRPMLAAAVSAAAMALLGAALPYKLGLVLAALTGISVGMFTEGHK